MRVETNGVRYSSFQELALAYNVNPVSKVSKDENKLNTQREKFVSRHKCKACGEPMTFVGGTNTMVCKNPSCKGIKIARKDKEGNDIVSYIPSYDILDVKGAEIALNIFA